jgi:hypothetical protein
MRTPDGWLREQQIGKPGSAKRLYWQFKQCFGSSRGSFYESLEFMKLLGQVSDHDDIKFLDKLAKGGRQFVISKQKVESEALVYFLPKVHDFLSSQKGIPYYLQTRRRLAAEMYVLTKKFEREPVLPIPKSPEELQTMIDNEVDKIISTQKWSRLEKRAGVPGVPPAPSGRKRQN